MTSTVDYQAQRSGPITLNLRAVAADIQVVADPGASNAWVELTAVDGDQNALQVIRNAEVSESGGEFTIRLREDLIRGAGGSVNMGGIQVGRNFGSVVMNGVTMIGGVSIGGILIRAILPAGSELDANTTSGDITTKGVGSLNIRTVSGDIEAEGVSQDSNLNTVSGDIEVSAGGVGIDGRATGNSMAVTGAGPRINASTVSGDVTSYGVRLRASTVSGRVRER